MAQWVAEHHGSSLRDGAPASSAPIQDQGDWLLTLIAQVTGETPAGKDDSLRLAEDLHLDSLGRVQLAAAIEERLGIAPADEKGDVDTAQTLGDLRRLLNAGSEEKSAPSFEAHASPTPAVSEAVNGRVQLRDKEPLPSQNVVEPSVVPAIETSAQPRSRYLYPHWPWLFPVRWLRVVFEELVMRPLVALLAKPRVVRTSNLKPSQPMLIIANHVTSFDGALLQYSLPGFIRRRMAIAMSGEMLEDFRHFRAPEGKRKVFLPGPLYYFLVTLFFNVFPLSRLRDFQRSFAHAGDALDHGYNVLIFPEGARSESGKMARFRAGIGLLVKQSGASVIPMAMRGLAI